MNKFLVVNRNTDKVVDSFNSRREAQKYVDDLLYKTNDEYVRYEVVERDRFFKDYKDTYGKEYKEKIMRKRKEDKNVIEIKEDVKINEDVILESGDKIEVLKERTPMIGSLVGKEIVEVKDYSDKFGYVRILFSDNTSLDLYDWAWYSY